MCREILVGHGLDIGQPLSGERRPLQGSAVNDIVKEDGILLPDFVFFVDDFVLDGGIGLCREVWWIAPRLVKSGCRI
jgi:hypothetical protein